MISKAEREYVESGKALCWMLMDQTEVRETA